MKNLTQKKRTEGFTIIEVMIVLAIAGLIMVIVFIAVPQLQRNERNTSRKNVIDRIVTEVNNYAGNNNGSIPTADVNATTGFVGTTGGFYQRYISTNASNFNDPQTGSPMTFAAWTSDAAVTSSSTVYYKTGRICSGESSTTTGANARNFIIMNKLEGGAIYCLDNQ